MKLGVVLLGVAVSLAGCPTGPVSPVPDSGDGAAPHLAVTDASIVPPGPTSAVCAAACEKLLALHCPEGASPSCGPVLTAIEGGRGIRRSRDGLALSCEDLAAATSVAQAQTLGVTCAP